MATILRKYKPGPDEQPVSRGVLMGDVCATVGLSVGLSVCMPGCLSVLVCAGFWIIMY